MSDATRETIRSEHEQNVDEPTDSLENKPASLEIDKPVGREIDEPAEVEALTGDDRDSSVADLIAPVSDSSDATPPAGDTAEAVLDDSADLADRADPESPAIESAPAGTDAAVPADPDELQAAVEAVLFVVESPVTVAQLASVLLQPVAEIEAVLDRIAERYSAPMSGIELRRIAGGVRIYTRPELTSVVETFLLDGQRSKLSQAALETLAVIAYRQPVSRGRISAIRGVNVDGVVRTLISRGLVVEDGTDPDSGAGVFRTTSVFLEKMGLQSLDELPSLAPLLPEIDSLETDEL